MDEPKVKKAISGIEAIGFVWDVLISVALPATVFALTGRWLDRRMNASPWFTAIGLVLALAISYFLVSRKANEYLARMKRATPPLAPPQRGGGQDHTDHDS